MRCQEGPRSGEEPRSRVILGGPRPCPLSPPPPSRPDLSWLPTPQTALPAPPPPTPPPGHWPDAGSEDRTPEGGWPPVLPPLGSPRGWGPRRRRAALPNWAPRGPGQPRSDDKKCHKKYAGTLGGGGGRCATKMPAWRHNPAAATAERAPPPTPPQAVGAAPLPPTDAAAGTGSGGGGAHSKAHHRLGAPTQGCNIETDTLIL